MTLFMDVPEYAPFGDVADVRCHLRVWSGIDSAAAVVSDLDVGDCEPATAMEALVDQLAVTIDSQIDVYELTSDEYEWQLFKIERGDDGSLGWSPLGVDDLAEDLGITVGDLTGEG